MIAQMMDDDRGPPVVTLRDRLQACREYGLPGIPAPELVEYVREIAWALDVLHDRGRSHGNVNPDTIRLENGRARLAKIVHPGTIEPGVYFGTPAYMGPEIWRGGAGPASDQYALAVSYVEMRRGRSPFPGQDFISLIWEHLEMKPDLAGMRAGESRILQTALNKDPRRRYTKCAQLAVALKGETATGL
jgi:serine/threonine protein kinase